MEEHLMTMKHRMKALRQQAAVGPFQLAVSVHWLAGQEPRACRSEPRLD